MFFVFWFAIWLAAHVDSEFVSAIFWEFKLYPSEPRIFKNCLDSSLISWTGAQALLLLIIFHTHLGHVDKWTAGACGTNVAELCQGCGRTGLCLSRAAFHSGGSWIRSYLCLLFIKVSVPMDIHVKSQMHLPLKDKNIFTSALCCLVSTLSLEELKNSKHCGQNGEENWQKSIQVTKFSFHSFSKPNTRQLPTSECLSTQLQLCSSSCGSCTEPAALWAQVPPHPMGKSTAWKNHFPPHHTCSTDPAGKLPWNLG